MRKKAVILITLLFFVLMVNVRADLSDYNTGDSGELGNLSGKGSWDQKHVGLKISISDASGNVKDSEIIWNNSNNYTCQKFSVSNYPKFKQETSIKWKNVDGSTIPRTSFIPINWISDGNMVNLNSHLSSNNYSNLLNILDLSYNNTKLFPDLDPGDFIIVEPMTYISGYCGTAFELGNAFLTLDSTCYSEGNFCAEYTGAIFGGIGSTSNPSRRCGGIFWQTIYLNTAVNELGLSVYSGDDLGCDTTSRSIFNLRHNCLKNGTCGRGIGVYRYDDIYSGSLKITKKETSTNSAIEGAGFTLYSDSSCNYVLKSEIKTNANGVATFKNLATGSYYYKETFVPDGYIGDTNCRKADIINGSETTATINNSKEIKQGNLWILVYKYPKEDDPILGKTTKINIFPNSNCTGPATEISVTGSNTQVLDEGNYSIEVKEDPGLPYTRVSGFTYTCTPFNISNSNTTNVKYAYTTSCESELALAKSDGVYSFNEAITLYNKYTDSKASLFDLDNPSCSRELNCNNNLTTSCLSASSTPILSSRNLSCANIKGDGGNRATTFCYEYFNLGTNLTTNSFYTKSGQFLIKKINIDDEYYYSWYDKDWNNIKVPSNNGIATLNLTKTCYSTNSSVTFSSFNSPKIFFGDNNNYLKVNSEQSSDNHIESPNIEGMNKFESSYTYNYDLNDIYIDSLTGKKVNASTNTTKTVQGILINFNDKATNKDLPFKIEYNGEKISPTESSCKYSTKQEIIKYPPATGELDLEFRTIDTKEPFNRKTMSNWSDKDDNSKDNNTVKKYIKDAVNSYGLDRNGNKADPKYKITLTPNDIKEIRNYNKTVPYDNYLIEEITYKGNKVFRNYFLHSLENGKLNDKNLSDKLYNLKYPI